jgi:hypothetical protein
MTQQDSGTVTVSLSQTLGSKSTYGSGSAAVTCDGQSHDYVVPVLAADGGRWRAGAAQASASASASGYGEPQQVCITNRDGQTECSTWTPYIRASASAGTTTITLTTPN